MKFKAIVAAYMFVLVSVVSAGDLGISVVGGYAMSAFEDQDDAAGSLPLGLTVSKPMGDNLEAGLDAKYYLGGFAWEGDIFGTPFYMAPEQWDDTHSVGHQTDVYSTGVALFKLLTGRFPVEGDTAFQIISKLMSGKKAHIRDYMPGIDKDLEHIIEKSIHVDLEKRYQTW